ncbi:aldose 1-epimerase [Planctomicrobium piriforme]|uniref:Aldose 1-epimerase n=1 Tax=Planctomicrobium piriforme TaxID=1576369 RepID=A0A1I3GWX9_9PLAN|nr:aldose 1-epimerase [Planctomicrobium piriforme]SFI27913.1 aldose 1-epimerase [Planctomicrobium piriforme]
MATSIRIHDSASGATALVAPELGFNCYAFSTKIHGKTVQIIDAPEDVLTGTHRPSGFGIPILFPFPNRIRDGKFTWDGNNYAVPLSPGKPNAIHGFCYDRPWRVIEKKKDTVTGQFQLSVDDPERRGCWPADFILDVRYRVAESRLECQFRITNPDKKPLPWGLGTHAYFRIPFGAASKPEQCLFSVPVSEQWELQDYLPTGRRLPVENKAPLRTGVRFGTQAFDDVFTGWATDGGTLRSSIIDEQAGIELTQICDSQYFREAVVFTPLGRNAVCMEPYTCVTDVINLEQRDVNAGLQVLAPGQVIQTWAAMQVSPVLA